MLKKTGPRLLRLGAILGNYAVFGGVLLLVLGAMPAATFIFFVFAAFVYVVIAMIWLITFGQLFAFPDPGFLSSGGPVFEWISKTAHLSAPYLFTFTAAFAVASIIIAALGGRRTGRIACSSVALGFAVIGMVLIYVIGGTPA